MSDHRKDCGDFQDFIGNQADSNILYDEEKNLWQWWDDITSSWRTYNYCPCCGRQI